MTLSWKAKKNWGSSSLMAMWRMWPTLLTTTTARLTGTTTTTRDRPVAEAALAVVDMRIFRRPRQQQASHMMTDQSRTTLRPLCRRGVPIQRL